MTMLCGAQIELQREVECCISRGSMDYFIAVFGPVGLFAYYKQVWVDRTTRVEDRRPEVLIQIGPDPFVIKVIHDMVDPESIDPIDQDPVAIRICPVGVEFFLPL